MTDLQAFLGALKSKIARKSKERYFRDALDLARIIDCNYTDLQAPQQDSDVISKLVSSRICNWYLPTFDNAFYGGIMTILRLADYLYRVDGVKSRFLICGSCETDKILSQISEAFPSLNKSHVIALDSVGALESIPPSDYSVASLWTTAYVLLKVKNTGYKFYIIQDFEPLFYPAGSTYSQAELTYSFGFYGIANTLSLKDIYSARYGGSSVVLTPNIDTAIFYPSVVNPKERPLRLFYYARPTVPRNCFELAMASFRLVKGSLGNSVEIICAGQNWDPHDYDLEGLVTTIGLLPYSDTGNLYRSCHVGLSMMSTPHPSYLPFEMMACGMLVVTNRNSYNSWLLKDRENCLVSEPTASCLAHTLIYGLENYGNLSHIRSEASSLIANNYGDWDASMSKVANFMHNPKDWIN